MLIVIPTVAFFITNIVIGLLKTINVIIRGWPPEHIDDSGDFSEYEEKEEENNDGS